MSHCLHLQHTAPVYFKYMFSGFHLGYSSVCSLMGFDTMQDFRLKPCFLCLQSRKNWTLHENALIRMSKWFENVGRLQGEQPVRAMGREMGQCMVQPRGTVKWGKVNYRHRMAYIRPQKNKKFRKEEKLHVYS